MAEVRVKLPGGGYAILIGAGGLAAIGSLAAKLPVTRRAMVVTDRTVGALFGANVMRSLSQAGFEAELVTMEAGETAKSLAQAEVLYSAAIHQRLDRRSPILALGGGVVGDLAGFVAATFQRGVPFIQLPTTLLAQVDASVGGKVAVNHPLGKNMIGAFYQPALVVADIDALSTLPERELTAGLAEVIKHGLIADPGFFDWLAENSERVKRREAAVLAEIVRRSCEIKADVVALDERESGARTCLNLGHTIAHAVETVTGYTVYRHGEAVAIGLYGATLLSHYLGLCSGDLVETVRSYLTGFGLPWRSGGCTTQQLFQAMSRDKKRRGDALRWVLLRGPGAVAFRDDVPEALVQRVLADIT